MASRDAEFLRLREQGEYRAALDVLLRRLRREGKSAESFDRARELLADCPAEHFAAAQLDSPYLAPIAVECARCLRFWFSGDTGRQCPRCRYTLCRDCCSGAAGCPAPGCDGSLGAMLRPTGRPRGKPEVTRTGKLESVLVLWQHRAPSTADVEDLLDHACTWQDRRGAWVITHQDAGLRRGTGEQLIAGYEYRGWLSPGAQGRLRVAELERFGLRLLLFVVAAPSG